MFALQRKLFEETLPATRENFRELTSGDGGRRLAAAVAECNRLYAAGDHKAYDNRKRALPAACFMCTFLPNQGTSGSRAEGMWRTQKAARLNGLVMHDFDKLSKVGLTWREVYDALPGHWFDDRACPTAIMMAYPTPSNDGLRLVTMADERLNIAENQQALLTRIKALAPDRFGRLKADESVINADRTSFLVDADRILFMNEHIFDYDNKKYDEKYGALYRTGHAPGCADKPAGAAVGVPDGGTGGGGTCLPTVRAGEQPLQQGGEGPGVDADLGHLTTAQTYHGVPWEDILQAWTEVNGGTPEVGDRHKTMLLLAGDLRYICDNNAAMLRQVLMKLEWVRRWIADDGAAAEVEAIIATVTGKELWYGMPKRLAATLKAVNIGDGSMRGSELSEQEEMAVYQNF